MESNGATKDISDVSIGCWSTISHPLLIEGLLSTESFQWICFDCEHSAISENFIQTASLLASKYQVKTFARIPSHDHYFARRILDLGVGGLIVPMVEDFDEFTNFLAHIRYGKGGKRGVCLSTMNLWGDHFNKYMSNSNVEIFAQIESVKGFEILEKIQEIEDLSGIFIGPYDLSQSLDIPGQFEHRKFVDILSNIFKIMSKYPSKKIGIHQVEPSPDELKSKISMGYKMIAYSTDMILMRESAKLITRIKSM